MTEAAAPTLKDRFEKLLDRRLMASLEACVRCGICAESCHYYQADPKPENTPFYRAEQVRSVYRSMFDPIGKIAPRWVGARPATQERMAELTDMAFTNCTLCRRCTVNCPFGVDTAAIIRSVRAIASATGNAPEILTQLADAAIAREETMDMFKDIYLEQITMMEEELQELSGDPSARIPVNVEGADVLYVALSGAHTILPAARLFHETGTNWSLSMFEAANYGLFIADTDKAKRITERIVKEAERLKVKTVVVTDCGHAYTTLRWEAPNWFGKPFPFEVRSLVELLADWITDGTLQVDPSRNTDPITYHDSCNLGRVSGLIEEPRVILRAVCQDFRDMTPNRENNYCCGGGGGLVALADATEKRIKAGEPKARQIRETGAVVVAASCDNCKIQLGDISESYGLGTTITGLPELVLNALIPARSPSERRPT
jgi:Fe-S oxidoreductase